MSNYKEIDIEDFIWDNLNGDTLYDRGLLMEGGRYLRQAKIPGCGIMDIVGFNVTKTISENLNVKCINIVVYELKREVITCAHVGQLSRYVNTIHENKDRIREHFGLPKEYTLTVRGVLIGAGIEKDAFHIIELSKCLSAQVFGFCFKKGLTFEYARNPGNFYDAEFSEIQPVSIFKLARATRHFIFDFTNFEPLPF